MLLRKKCYGSTEHTEDTDFLSTEDTFFLVATLEILEEMFFKMLLRKKYCGFTVYLQTKSLTKIFDYNALFLRVLPWARETIGLSARFCLCIKIFRRIQTENAQQYVALLEGFLGDRIGDARNLNENLKENL